MNILTSSFTRVCISRARCTFIAGTVLAAVGQVAGQGIPEPSLIFYGQVLNPTNGPTARLIAGTITWSLQPTGGGAPVVVTTQLTNAYDPFSFIVQVPCESQFGTLVASTNVLQLTSPPQTYSRVAVFLKGQPIYLKYPTQTLFSVTSTNRGRVERVDLTVIQSDQDSNGSGLPDGWQMQYFGQLGVNPNADPDHDGMGNLAEYLAGTNPTNSSSAFKFTRISRDPAGGIDLDWLSASNRTYILQRSFTSIRGFVDIATDLAAMPPLNSYHDTTATDSGPYFYRLKLDQGQMSLVDLDVNGLPDAWERQYFGQIHIDANADPDGDGFSNLQEYLAGTDPTDSTSNLRGVSVKALPHDGVVITWSSVVNKSYTLLRSTNVLSGYQVVVSGVSSTPPLTAYHDTNTVRSGAYYRISTP